MKKIIFSLILTGIILAFVGCSHKHDFSDASCLAPKTCTECGETERTALGHQWNEATCMTAKTCAVCGETEGTRIEHDTTDGKCSMCGLDYYEELQSLIMKHGEYLHQVVAGKDFSSYIYKIDDDHNNDYGIHSDHVIRIGTDTESCWLEYRLDNKITNVSTFYTIYLEPLDVKSQRYSWKYLVDPQVFPYRVKRGSISGKVYAPEFSKKTDALVYDTSSFEQAESGDYAQQAAMQLEFLIERALSEILKKSEHELSPVNYGFERFE